MGTGSGKKKIAISKIEDIKRRRVTFTKRRQGLFKKSDQLPSLTGCRVSVLCFSSAMKPFLYGDLSLLEQAAATGAINTFGNSNSGDVVASVGDNLGHGEDEEKLLTDREFAELMEHDLQELAQFLEFDTEELDELLECYDQDPANAASCSMNTSSDLIQYNRNAPQQIASSTSAATFQHSKSGWPSDIASVGDNLGHGEDDQRLLTDHELAEFMEHDPQELAQILEYDENPSVSAACCGMNTSNDPIQYNRNALQQITPSTSAAMLPRSYDPSAASYTNNNIYASEFMEFDDQELAQLLEFDDQDLAASAAMNTSSDLIQYYNSNALQQIAPFTSAATFQDYYSYNPPSAAYISNIDINSYVSEEMLQVASSSRNTDSYGFSYDPLKLLA